MALMIAPQAPHPPAPSPSKADGEGELGMVCFAPPLHPPLMERGPGGEAPSLRTHHRAVFPRCDGRFDDELRFEGIGARAVDLLRPRAGKVLLHPPADAACERLAKAHHP